ncbi:bifunctional folylpolyglutamate synthase/dihydrofolate synthase [Granulicoccus phenolivorans]|uniref:bifunctional folylpolyglutamate synthase/dihydrofolate synthase n=1 Tax=Granulicoccus phenolivorans TaxID=266854 RepID=UPI000ACE3996|nr:Mur ligase family protein [Granulicoccus phenolivorans]
MTMSHAELVAALTARWPEHRIGPGLERERALLQLLGDPQTAYPVIQITGTNGKGSTATMIESLLRSVGLRTGRLSSPHLIDVTERISIDGQDISQQRFAELWSDIEPYVKMVDEMAIDGIAMTFFEVITAMAYAAFADAPVDVAVVEVGLGGTWDATSVADAAVAVVLPIDLDHMHILGPTIADIAKEKAGIIKPGSHAVLAGQQPEAAAVLLARAAEVGADVRLEGRDFGLLDRQPGVGGQVIRLQTADGPLGDLTLPVYGAHMARNAAVALAAVEAFLGNKPLSAEVIADGFAEVTAPGRLELVRTDPSIVLDGAHNPHAARAAAEAVEEAYGFAPLIGVVAMMADKDAEEVLRIWEPVMSQVVCTQVSSTSRALPAEDLADIATGIFGVQRVRTEPSLGTALEVASMLADLVPDGQPGILVTGSVIAAGEARALLVSGGPRQFEEVEPDPDDDPAPADPLTAFGVSSFGADGFDEPTEEDLR